MLATHAPLSEDKHVSTANTTADPEMVCTLSGVEVKVLVDKMVVNWVAVGEGTHAMLDCAVLSCSYEPMEGTRKRDRKMCAVQMKCKQRNCL